ncbi:heavy-metal-associated domain-containing protein [Novosphingobium sp.]|uniref:heavy-metal-associated domain-containing protein n=1 Tax=Novosphingobium sp. TaxID=1874826 RepID=UPI0025E42B41|nr:heavy-metal-associated domain-containing protein [Novosphingobium sp.]MCC6925330.1 heavy-metal-associated domain-containing protein [Novosphingobium sp.]
MAVAIHLSSLRTWRPGPAATLLGGLALALIAGLLALGPARLWAQIEGDRGIVPVASTSDIQINDVEVNTTGSNAQEARSKGWQEAARLAWKKAGGPSMDDGSIQSMVSAVVIQREQIGPRRYIATLGVVFDRARAGQYLGGTNGGRAHSAPLLVIPVLYSGGVAQVFEVKGPWQKAWAEFRAGNSPIDYVRPVGAGGDSLLVTAGQPGRRSRAWWRNVLSQYGARDVIVPEARLERQWPGGPVRGTFTARYGPDNTFLGSFTLTANDEAGLPKMLSEAVVRLDQLYGQALEEGQLKPDTSLNMQAQMDPGLAALIAAGQAPQQAAPSAAPTAEASATPTPTAAPVETRTFTVQFASPDAGAVDAALGAVRSAPGVKGASTTSLAMGGTSVMRVTYEGDIDTLAAALRGRGWRVTVGANALSIKR